nr:LytTR family DNA-binding domain-containing protein [Lactobacillus johnsonii]
MNIIYEHNMAITKDKAEGIISDNYDIVFDIASANNFVNAKKYLEVNSYDGGIYFLDIELGREIGKNNGFDLAGLIKKQDKKAQIIFITTHADLSLISFERRLGPIDYIVKPKNEDEYTQFQQRVVETVEIAISNLKNFDFVQKMTFHYKVGRQIRNVNIDDIIYIATTGTPHKLEIVKTNGRGQFFGSISKYAKENSSLVKISQSCLVNPNNIELIDLKKYKVTICKW